jgi:hypothetical protein
MCGQDGFNMRPIMSSDMAASGREMPSDGLGLREECCSSRWKVGWSAAPELGEVSISSCEDGFQIFLGGKELVRVRRTTCFSCTSVEYSLTMSNGSVGSVTRMLCGPARYDAARRPFAVIFPSDASAVAKALTVMGIVRLDLLYARRERDARTRDADVVA